MNKSNLLTLKGHDSFKKVFEKGKKIYRDEAMLVFNKKVTTENTIYYGVSIGKRNAKKAVIRNRVKRLIRESINCYTKELENNLPFENFVFIWRKAPKMQSLIDLNDVKPIVYNMFNEAIEKTKK
ncbi:MAG: ribonuclease P protein component [Candidatus Kapabacteria bacterium]|nr:ribonuclease P protein component [Candidatus Kapabacteria bacterium]